MNTPAALILICALLATVTITESASAEPVVNVYAAASLTQAFTEIGEKWTAAGRGKILPAFAGSSALAKQIENGAPVDVFVSADSDWMDYLESRKLIAADTRINLLGNRLALIAPVESDLRIEITPGMPIGNLLGTERLAAGDPDHVPAGKYAKEAFKKLGVWKEVEPRLARADNVRAALALVERKECPLGAVYSSDAAMSKKVRLVALFPEDSHPRIVYPAALVGSAPNDAARAFLEFLKTPESKAVFLKYGFTTP